MQKFINKLPLLVIEVAVIAIYIYVIVSNI